MTGNATALTRETAARAKENRAYVRHLLKVRQPQFAAAVESAIQQLLRDHGTSLTSASALSSRVDNSCLRNCTAGGPPA
jgi:hypothetical protein